MSIINKAKEQLMREEVSICQYFIHNNNYGKYFNSQLKDFNNVPEALKVLEELNALEYENNTETIIKVLDKTNNIVEKLFKEEVIYADLLVNAFAEVQLSKYSLFEEGETNNLISDDNILSQILRLEISS